MIKILAFSLALLSMNGFAQEGEAAKERSRLAIDNAMEQARSQAVQIQNPALQAERPRGIQYEDLKKQQGVDPAELANQYREIVKAQKKAGPDLLVFVSTSMPIPTLKHLAVQIRQAGGVMVFRGITGGLNKKAFNEWLALLKPVAETGASIQIDPESFGRYNITAVPTFVIAARREGDCGGTSCAVQTAALAGDVTLEYALEKLSSRGGDQGRIADTYLSRLERK